MEYLTYKVDGPLDYYLKWTPIFEWHMIGCGSKSRYQMPSSSKKLDCILKIWKIIQTSIVYVMGGGGTDVTI